MTENLQRFAFDADARQILVSVGKVEIGQHVHKAYQTIVAESLGIAEAHVRVSPVTTESSPDDGLTAGSLSMQITGTSLRSAAISLRSTLIQEAAQRFASDENDVILDADALELQAHGQHCSIFDLAVSKHAPVRATGDATDVGTTFAGSTISASIRGERLYIQDLILPGMIHARALRGRDINLDDTKAVKLVKNGGFTALVANTQTALDNAWAKLEPKLPARDTSCDGPIENWIQSRPVKTQTTGESTALTNPIKLIATRPFFLHASIAPSCAIARFQTDMLEIWTHSQGIFPLRNAIAKQIGMDPEQVIVRHIPSAGSYGHNAADDAAMDAVLVSLQHEGAPVRVAWTRQDDFRYAPVGAPMLVQIEAELNEDSSIGCWRQSIWSGPHGQRPGGGGNVNLLGSIEQDPCNKSTNIPDLPDAVGGGAARNAQPPYSIGSIGVTTHLVQDLPVRTSSIRGLGAQMNVIGIEATMDKLAERCAMDPLEFRLKHIEDQRANEVLGRLQSVLANTSQSLEDSEAIGIAYSRYKDRAAYTAVAVRVRLTDKVELLDVWAVVDAGRIVDMSGALNQIEGGIIQAASWTLCEGVLLRDGYVDASGWDDYPILGWSDVPEIHTILVDASTELPSLGIGECMVGPVSAAIVNAVSKLAACSMADLPLTREKFIAAASTAG